MNINYKTISFINETNNLEQTKDTFICGDALQTMKKLPSCSFDLVITSPPYNLLNTTGGGMKNRTSGNWKNSALMDGYTHHSDNMPHNEYVEWQRSCLTEMMRLIKDTGAIFYNHKWRVQNGLIQDRSDIVDGFPVRQIIIWKRKGGLNHNKKFFLPTYEVIYLIAKPNFELVPKASGVGDVWEFAHERNNPHPAPFPVPLAERIIKSTTAQLILDPFMGSGTTALAAKILKRNFVGIDISPNYVEMSKQRLEQNLLIV